MATIKYILQGGGEHARVVLDCLLSQGSEVAGLFDPKHSGHLFGVPQLGKYDPHFKTDALAIVAIGDNAARKKVAALTKHQFGNAIHPSAILSPHSTWGQGSMILHGAIVQAQTRIGHHAILNTGCRVDHDCHIEDFVHIAPGAILCGTITVGEGTLIGAGTIIKPGIKIGSWATIGAGSVVIRDVPDNATVVGNPGRLLRMGKP